MWEFTGTQNTHLILCYLQYLYYLQEYNGYLCKLSYNAYKPNNDTAKENLHENSELFIKWNYYTKGNKEYVSRGLGLSIGFKYQQVFMPVKI